MKEELFIQVPKQLSRREFLKVAGATGLGAFLVACGANPTATSEAVERTMAIQPWPGSYEDIFKKYVYEPFTAKTGVKITSTPQAEWYNLAKIKQEVDSGNPTLDISVQLPGDVVRGGKDGLFEEINVASVPMTADLFDQAKALLPWGLGYLVYSYGIGYRPGTGDYSSWWDIWDPKYAGRLSLGKTETTYVVQTINRLITGKMSPVDTDAVFAKLDELKPNIKKMFESDADLRNMYNAEEIDAFVFFNGRVAVQQDDGIDVLFSSPSEGAFAAFDFLCITKNSKNKDIAQEFINFSLEPEQQVNIGKYMHYGPTNKTVTFDDPKYCAVMPCGGAMDSLWFEDAEYVSENQDAWIERWNEWLAG
ncbi:MAG: hypothetical protein A2X25_02325 [Chloroflexi bacterium GWB2_49_20]|nr:MAG: hypothetical protein A2X25_02325 [Chloroflexi bacterium GWB2_49_20]OGN79691.1 MAG: hypothetical protein A2X26_07305 [Chloroflexi bacterium GWC2_49_37]OGN85939.1 MAG: hypothetical protein A2X27_00065 [Chloroflexi bacterium GWD2_49_16]HBG74002.1 hypothetical protein [Anaerolineae bacterium]HCC78732.1 hypothetical protein [Anaerolineae bacterium]